MPFGLNWQFRLAGILLILIRIAPSQAAEPLRCFVGREGAVVARLPADGFVVREQDRDSPVRVWVESVRPEKEGFVYDLRFVPQQAGEYDLLDTLKPPDGRVVNDAAVPILVRAVSQASALDGRLALPELPPTLVPRHYRAFVAIGLTLWVACLVVLIYLYRNPARQSPTLTPSAPSPSPAQRLSSLIDLLKHRPLAATEQIELERLVLHDWQSQLHATIAGRPNAPRDEIVLAMMSDRRGRRVLGVLNDWLYSPEGVDREDLLAILVVRPERPPEPM